MQMENETELQDLLLLSEVESLSLAEFLTRKFLRRLEANGLSAGPHALGPEQRALVLQAFQELFAGAPQERW